MSEDGLVTGWSVYPDSTADWLAWADFTCLRCGCRCRLARCQRWDHRRIDDDGVEVRRVAFYPCVDRDQECQGKLS